MKDSSSLKKSIEFSRLVDPALRSRPLGGRSLRAAVSEDHAGVCTTVRMSFTVFLWEINYEGCTLNRVIRFNKTRGGASKLCLVNIARFESHVVRARF